MHVICIYIYIYICHTFTCWANRKELGIDVLSQLVAGGLVDAVDQFYDGFFPDWRLAHVYQHHSLDVFPHPRPCNLISPHYVDP